MPLHPFATRVRGAVRQITVDHPASSAATEEPDPVRRQQNRTDPLVPSALEERQSAGPKPPLMVREIWGIRIRPQLVNALPDLVLFELAIDSNLRGCLGISVFARLLVLAVEIS